MGWHVPRIGRGRTAVYVGLGFLDINVRWLRDLGNRGSRLRVGNRSSEPPIGPLWRVDFLATASLDRAAVRLGSGSRGRLLLWLVVGLRE
jgi:hypothetical protein